MQDRPVDYRVLERMYNECLASSSSPDLIVFDAATCPIEWIDYLISDLDPDAGR